MTVSTDSPAPASTATSRRVATGVPGLDAVLDGGLPQGHLYLLEGPPGSGKTTLALQFLLEAARAGEPVLYVTLSETASELSKVAASHGWSLAGVSLFEASEAEPVLGVGQTVLHSWEVELEETVQLITDRIESLRPTRVVLDSLSEMRLLAEDDLRYRRQVLGLKQFFAQRGITVLLTDDQTAHHGQSDAHLHSLCHGVVTLERKTLEFGGARRRMEVKKLRGVQFVAGFHDLALRPGGVVVFPRLIAAAHHTPFVGEAVSSGLREFDAMLAGGPLRGTSALIMGPAGSGKTNLAVQYVDAACRRGERAVLYEFDERVGTLLQRARLIGQDLQAHLDAGLLEIHQLDASEVAPGEFAARVRQAVEAGGVRLVVIDSLSGYVTAMPQEKQLVLQLHELLAYLNQQGVLTLMLNAQQGLVGSMASGDVNVSYLADTVVLLRYFEAAGRVRKAVSVIKNRGGAHEETIRELRIDAQGVRIGGVLTQFHGVLTGVPTYVGEPGQLLAERPLDA